MQQKKTPETLNDILDWEYLSDYYTEAEHSVPLHSLEEYAKDLEQNKENDFTNSMLKNSKETDELKRIAQHIHTIRTLSVEGKTIQEIAAQTNLDSDYITKILITLQGYPEDNDIAAAHLILLG